MQSLLNPEEKVDWYSGFLWTESLFGAMLFRRILLHFYYTIYIYDSHANTSLINCARDSVCVGNQDDSKYFKLCKKAVTL